MNKRIMVIIFVVFGMLVIAGSVWAISALTPAIDKEEIENGVLAKDDTSIAAELPKDAVFDEYTEEQKEILLGEERINKVIADAKAEIGAKNVVFYPEDCRDMTKSQIKTYVQLISQSGHDCKAGAMGSFPRIRESIINKTPAAERLTVEALDAIIAQSRSVDELFSNITEKYGAADYSWADSGNVGGTAEYWLGDTADKAIVLRYGPDDWLILLRIDGEQTPLYSEEDLRAHFTAEPK